MNGHDSLIDIFNMEAARVAELDAKHLQEFHRIDVTGIKFQEIGVTERKVENEYVRQSEKNGGRMVGHAGKAQKEVQRNADLQL